MRLIFLGVPIVSSFTKSNRRLCRQ